MFDVACWLIVWIVFVEKACAIFWRKRVGEGSRKSEIFVKKFETFFVNFFKVQFRSEKSYESSINFQIKILINSQICQKLSKISANRLLSSRRYQFKLLLSFKLLIKKTYFCFYLSTSFHDTPLNVLMISVFHFKSCVKSLINNLLEC